MFLFSSFDLQLFSNFKTSLGAKRFIRYLPHSAQFWQESLKYLRNSLENSNKLFSDNAEISNWLIIAMF